MKHIVLPLLLMVAGHSYAQLDPTYAQYLNNPLVLNPASAGYNNRFNANVQYRIQWSGLDASPTTLNFSSHMPVFHNKVGLGLMVVEDRLGEHQNADVNTLYSYRLDLGEGSSLSFGMQFGITRYMNSTSGLTIRDPGDPVFNSYSKTNFNTGAGVMYRNDRLMLGLAVPRMLPVTVTQDGQRMQVARQNYYLYGSYLYFLSEDIRFRPSALVRGMSKAPLSVDLNTSFVYKQTLAAGIFTRNFKTYGLLFNALIKNLRVGYVFEVPGSKSSSLNFVTHEVSLGISLALLNEHDKYPVLY